MYPPANFWRLDGWHGCTDVRKKPSTVLAEGSLSSISAMEVFDFLCRFVRFHNPLDISIGDIGAILSNEAKHLCLAPIELGEQRSQTFETQPIFLFHFLRPPFGHLYITICNLYVNNNLNILVAGGWLSYATSSTAPIRRRLLAKKRRPAFRPSAQVLSNFYFAISFRMSCFIWLFQVRGNFLRYSMISLSFDRLKVMANTACSALWAFLYRSW